MASAVANLAVMLTARTGKFAADMNSARRPLMRLQSAARTVQRSIRLAFSFVLARGFIRTLSQSVVRARELGVQIDAIGRARIDGLVRSYQAFSHVMARLAIVLVTSVAPVLENIIDKLTATVLWIEKRLTPAVKAHIATFIKLAVPIYGVVSLFTDLSDEAMSAGKEVDELKAKMRGLSEVKVGRLGIDFAPISTVAPSSEAGRALAVPSASAEASRSLEEAAKQASAAASIEALRQDIRAREQQRREESSRRYTNATSIVHF